MDYIISVSHSDFYRFKNNIDKVVETCSVSGFSGIEGHQSLFEGMNNSELENAGEYLREGSVKTMSFHLPCSVSDELDLVSPDSTNRKTAVKIYKEWIGKASVLGFKKAVIHGTTRFPSTAETDLSELTDRFFPPFEELLKTAEEYGMMLALENQNPSVKKRFGSEAEHLYEIRKRMDSSSFSFCFDFGHAYLGYKDNYSELYDVMKGKIEAVHVHGNYGTEDIHLPPGYGSTDWDIVKTFLHKINLPLICIESSPHPSIDHFFPSDWKKLYTETCELFGH